jgi:hypothetical protein
VLVIVVELYQRHIGLVLVDLTRHLGHAHGTRAHLVAEPVQQARDVVERAVILVRHEHLQAPRIGRRRHRRSPIALLSSRPG